MTSRRLVASAIDVDSGLCNVRVVVQTRRWPISDQYHGIAVGWYHGAGVIVVAAGPPSPRHGDACPQAGKNSQGSARRDDSGLDGGESMICFYADLRSRQLLYARRNTADIDACTGRRAQTTSAARALLGEVRVLLMMMRMLLMLF